ncbi:MAG: AAA family ATPase [Chitinivibrionales bacterium]|nr:AAA family ATPase [Chitinivibrionales bacterium]
MATVYDILAQQKEELHEYLRQPYVERRVAVPSFDSGMVTVALGPRRSGKSFFCCRLLTMQCKRYGYVNLDDERLVQVDDYDQIIDAAGAVYGSPKCLMLDEIQNLPRWELLVNRLQRRGMRLIVTGSNAHLLSAELATHLTGRHLQLILFPFSFAEYLDATMEGKARISSAIDAALHTYLRNGGMPETVVTSVNAHDYLTTLFSATIYKDIVKRHRVTAPRGIESLARHLLSNTGCEYSYRTLRQVAGCKSERTVRKYLDYLEGAFLVFSLERFSFKVREQTTHNKKIYAIDNGFVTTVGFAMSPNTGRLAENAVAVVLHKQHLEGRIQLFFWKSAQHHEVDFVVVEDLAVHQLIQVCWDLENQKTVDREVRALLKAGHELRCHELLVLTRDKEAVEEVSWFGLKGAVRFEPLHAWLLNQTSGQRPASSM